MHDDGTVPEEILRQRALLYASDNQEKVKDVLDNLLVFHLGEQCFGISMKVIQKIDAFNDGLFIPRAGPSILGLTNILGVFLPVVDIRQLLHLPPLQALNKNTCNFIVIEPSIVFIVDHIVGVASISSSSIMLQEVSSEKNMLIRSIVELNINNEMYQVAWLKDSICEEIL